MFLAHLDQHLAHVTNILLPGSRGSRTDAEVPSNTESVLDSTRRVCAFTHTQRRNTTRKRQKRELVQKDFVIFPLAEWGGYGQRESRVPLSELLKASWLAPYLAHILVSWRKETSHFLDLIIKGNTC